MESDKPATRRRYSAQVKAQGRDPYAYLKDVLERLPTLPASRIGDLLPHRWQPGAAAI